MVAKQDILNANILLVDDQLVNIKLLEKMLRQTGFNSIFSTTQPQEVKSLYFDNEIDLILLDIRMPEMDGFEVMAQLQAEIENDYLPILVVTAELTSQTRERALSSGAKDFITKPFDQSEVIQRIFNMLEVRLLHKKVLLQNETLEEQVRQRTHQLEESRLEIIKRLGRAAEYKDNETGNHILRMSHFAQMLAKAAGLSQEQSDNILLAAPMHDIGKIGIPDSILKKNGRLTEEEYEVMKTHCEIGARIIGEDSSELLQMAKTVALTHHEKWNGKGYPGGLQAEDIPRVGRIVAIADVFDALTSKRPYKKVWTVEKALTLMREASGKHFDPTLFALFVQSMPEILSIKELHNSHPE